ncbi:hypothetical protein [Haloglomus salinum]|uniref:hypothetical protein n=1 Tax=Haloglomus salinum TaxID=2962673 RepID=UPI0020CA2566|nr:hypothetical protein [Haloglomus salinum]
MAGPSIVDTLAGRLVAGAATFVTMVVVAAAVAPHIRATGVPYTDLVATGIGGLVAFLAVMGRYRIYRGSIGGG